MTDPIPESADFVALSQRLLVNLKPLLWPERRSARTRAQYVAVCNWLSKYTAIEPTHRSGVKGMLEAFHHCCDGEAWKAAQIILSG